MVPTIKLEGVTVSVNPCPVVTVLGLADTVQDGVGVTCAATDTVTNNVAIPANAANNNTLTHEETILFRILHAV